jgi:hypothetical protein
VSHRIQFNGWNANRSATAGSSRLRPEKTLSKSTNSALFMPVTMTPDESMDAQG